MSPAGDVFEVIDGVPDFTWPPKLAEADGRAREHYDSAAETYDRDIDDLFAMFGADEAASRNAAIDQLHLRADMRVLETGAGSGRDSELIARRLGPDGLLCVQDISKTLFTKALRRLDGCAVPVAPHIGNACYLPFPDNSFDAYFHAGAINCFSDIPRALSEAARVTRPGGRVVVADENVPVWLRQTALARNLINANPLFAGDVPLAHLPVEARDVSVRWTLGGVFYELAFRVGTGEPVANVDAAVHGGIGGADRAPFGAPLKQGPHR
ncbi:methyltransferase domain-containing protein [Breoghania sp. L-A4]|uniref:class I SAM-dependent methyltransferase n=1 Tax=Breoghania sp. L-A4 TaxID=2304600 RepID=UPI0013C34AFF|nr:methyltransferase domain-containing protein [Breoghania sp. L-A4]